MRLPYVILLSACGLILASPLLAQSPNGVINGLVADPSNKVLARADILVINDATGVKYSSQTNNDGIYIVPNLPPGPYRIQVSKSGFKTLIKPDIVLNVQDALSINFTLPIGAVFEIVTVEGGASMINTTDASVSTVVDQTYVKNMPLNGRSFQDLILLTPGAVTQMPPAAFGGNQGLGMTGEFSVNGQRTESNYYTVDGVSANVGAASGTKMTDGSGPSGSLAASTALGTTQALVSVDALQEFRVQSSTYSAEYGRNPGGQFAFQTKSGTNQSHGTAYDYLRNGFCDAQDWFNDYLHLPEPAIRQNDFGGTLGGTVTIPSLYAGRDKTFFFVSYEGLRLAVPRAASVNSVPDEALRASTPAPLSQVLNAFPVQSPTGIDDASSGIAQFIGTWSDPSSIDSTSARLDHAVNDKVRLFFRFSDAASDSTNRGVSGSPPTMDTTLAYNLRTYTAGANSAFTSRFSNEFRGNYSSNEVTSSTVIDAFGGSTPVNLIQLTGLGPGSSPSVNFIYGGYDAFLGASQSAGSQSQWNLVDTVGLSIGRHQFKFGVDYRRLAPVATPVNPFVPYYYFSETAVQANSPFGFAAALAPAHPLYTNFSAFAQDEWKLSRRLSVSFGLRWEVNPPPGVTQGQRPYTVKGSGPGNWTLASEGTPLWQTTRYNFAPRLGAAYILHDSHGQETVVRVGGGVFFDTGQQLGSIGFSGPGFTVFGDFLPQSFPVPPAVPRIVNPPVAPYGQIIGFPRHLQLPYTLQWNASIEHALGKSQSLTISYVGSHATRLLQENDFQTPDNPNASEVLLVQNGLTSDFDSLQMQFRRRLSRGLTALAAYTWSHCIDYGSENYNYGYQRGSCDSDVRNSVSGALSWDLPNATGNAFARALVQHWGLDSRFTARTSFPVTLDGMTLVDPTNGRSLHAGLNVVPGQPIYLFGANCASVLQALEDLQTGQGCPGGRALNPNAFVAANSGVGDAPRNFVRGFEAWQMDLAVRREFPIYENLKLQFRAEAFNIFNHPNFGTVNPNFGQNTFGQATSTLANSLGILNSLYQQGGPRSMQFALKLIF